MKNYKYLYNTLLFMICRLRIGSLLNMVKETMKKKMKRRSGLSLPLTMRLNE